VPFAESAQIPRIAMRRLFPPVANASDGASLDPAPTRTRRPTKQPTRTNETNKVPIMLLSSNKFFSLAAALTLTVAAQAQGSFGSLGSLATYPTAIFVPATPPVLPTVQSKFNSYAKSIGNSDLGGSVSVYAGIVRQKSGSYELGNASAEFRAVGRIFGYSKELAEIVGSASNVMNNGVQTRSGQFRLEVLDGIVYGINQSFTNSSTFGAGTNTYNLFGSSGLEKTFWAGPVPITLAGNAGCTFSRSFNWLLPAATASVGLNATGNAYAFADCHVGFGVSGFSVGGGFLGKVLDQTVNGSVTANAVWGLSGSLTYQLKAISLTLYVYAEAFWQSWTHNITTWAAGLVNLTLI